jgi:predicted MFS family arabinose efflux permease
MRALLLAESVSTTGGQMSGLALPWFVLTTTGSAKEMSYVVATEIAAYVICGIPAGSVIARLGSRQTMRFCDGLRGPLMLLIPVLHAFDSLVFGELLAVAFVLGALSAPYGGAQRVITAELFQDDPGLVGQANALFQGATRITLVAGPPVAGILIGLIGAPYVLVVDAATFAFSFLVLTLFVPEPTASLADDEPPARLLDGLRYLRRDRLLAAFSGAISIGDAAFQVIFISLQVLVVDHYGGNARLVGVFLGAWGGGCVLGNVIAYRLNRHGLSPRAIAALVLVQALPLLTLATPVPAWVLALALGVSGLGNGLVNPALHSMLTLRPPARVRANVLTALFTASAIGAPAALLIAGPAFDAFGSRAVIGVAAALQVVAMVWLGAAALQLADVPAPAA